MSKSSYQQLELSSYLSGSNAGYVEEVYESFLQDPTSVDAQWRMYFQSLSEDAATAEVSHKHIREKFSQLARQPKQAAAAQVAVSSAQEGVDGLIAAYRRYGHLNAKTDPLGAIPATDTRLTLAHHNLGHSNLNETFKTRGILETPTATLEEIFQQLQRVYCSAIGIEFSLISDDQEREWLRDYIEHRLPALQFDADTKKAILQKLVAADGLEKFLDSKYPGQKRFSVEGGDSLLPFLDQLSLRARSKGLSEIIIGMAHRGRLNVLMNIMGQSPAELCQEFEGIKDYGLTSGDVKYHRGFSSDVSTQHGTMHLSLSFNPSHLEFISAVVMGSVRARQERDRDNGQLDYAMGVAIHGDAAFIGQGIVMETLSMSQTRAYHIGGTIHIVINNQVGFTTSDPRDSRSSHYCTDIARMIDAPVLHVNGDDPESVVACAQMAMDYRMRFHKDIVVDLVCYRRHGHQEVDEPRATQPIMYKIISEHQTAQRIYADKLIKQNLLTEDELQSMITTYRDHLDHGRTVVDLVSEGLSDHHAANWTPFLDRSWREQADTSVAMDKLKELGKKLTRIPENFVMQRNVARIYQAREKMADGSQPLDWGFAENLAYATLAVEGYPVRLSGEDVRRGTFFHRHAAVFDQNTGEAYMPLTHLSEKQSSVQIYDSLLSEAGPMGFEYGYTTAEPNTLVLWEAQFGDFANGGQVIIDQFMSSAWQKWNRLSGLGLLLPHGNEGMGPEHSSARLERFLQLCAQENIQVVVPTTPSQIFHLLRRQVLRPYRKPLVVMSPKSLLRHKLATSTLDDLAHGQFQLLINEQDPLVADNVTRVIICCGKVYYELLAQRREVGLENIAIIRIEQLYPFPYDELEQALSGYPNAKDIVWCQEEPKNQGAWFSTRHRIIQCLPEGCDLHYVGRRAMSALITLNDTLLLAQSIDTLVEGVHFFKDTDPEALGHKSLAVSLSDMAAMGARPTAALLSLTLPQADEHWLRAFQQGFYRLAKQFTVDLIGGDTCQGPLSISTVVQGVVNKKQALLRSGANPGDLIFVSGTLGDAAFAVSQLQQKNSVDDFFRQRLQKPDPRVALGILLCDVATSAIDISDGLVTDLKKIMTKSDVGAVIYTNKLPLSKTLISATGNKAAINFALTGGDDYELCFTVPKDKIPLLKEKLSDDTAITCIGEMNPSKQLAIKDKNDVTIALKQDGYEHFSKK
jgi:2-oxoglutarate dehydrogenase E1 component